MVHSAEKVFRGAMQVPKGTNGCYSTAIKRFPVSRLHSGKRIMAECLTTGHSSFTNSSLTLLGHCPLSGKVLVGFVHSTESDLTLSLYNLPMVANIQLASESNLLNQHWQ